MRAESPRREAAQRIRGADRDLRDEDRGRGDRERAEPGGLAAMAPCLDARRDDEKPDPSCDVAVKHRDGGGAGRGKVDGWVQTICGCIDRVRWRVRLPAQGPPRASNCRVHATNVRAAHEQNERSRGRGDREPRPARRARACRRRPADHDREHRERREEQLGVREVDRHPLGRELEHDGDRAEHRLQGVKHRGDEGDREHAPIGAVDDDRPHDHRGNREPGDDREEAMRPLDTSRRVERRQELAVAKRPIGTPEARAGHADDAAPDHDEERRQKAHVDDRAIARRKTHPMRLRPKPRGASARRLP